MKLVLKIAAGILLAFGILWATQVGFVVVALSAISSVMSEKFSPKNTASPQPQLRLQSQPSGKQFQIPRPPVRALTTAPRPRTTAPRPRRRIIGYEEKWVSGRPLGECLGPDKELNPAVLRCRNGYPVKIPIYSD